MMRLHGKNKKKALLITTYPLETPVYSDYGDPLNGIVYCR
jgi:hypothetical protein